MTLNLDGWTVRVLDGSSVELANLEPGSEAITKAGGYYVVFGHDLGVTIRLARVRCNSSTRQGRLSLAGLGQASRVQARERLDVSTSHLSVNGTFGLTTSGQTIQCRRRYP